MSCAVHSEFPVIGTPAGHPSAALVANPCAPVGNIIAKPAGVVAGITQSRKAVTSALRPYEGSNPSRPSGAGLFGVLT